ncbi:hypothetical protein E2C01_008153 [Portunus trituberculatus]|uniref:Uncharacterized protein n=1 Tax=Portunus trituberculatus TaxID=210409 RepID=A0A5B7D362_PORTR|nr:hypothetical protein [Portunus trituberculatus]
MKEKGWNRKGNKKRKGEIGKERIRRVRRIVERKRGRRKDDRVAWSGVATGEGRGGGGEYGEGRRGVEGRGKDASSPLLDRQVLGAPLKSSSGFGLLGGKEFASFEEPNLKLKPRRNYFAASTVSSPCSSERTRRDETGDSHDEGQVDRVDR